MEHPYVYIGCFLSASELYAAIDHIRSIRLSKTIEFPHVTFVYRPQAVDESLFGEKIKLRIVGYGNDGINEGLKVELASTNETINEMAAQIAVPHITLSVSEDGESVNTRYLQYAPIVPIELTGVWGGYTDSREVVTHVNE